jgi:hypothetical protein
MVHLICYTVGLVLKSQHYTDLVNDVVNELHAFLCEINFYSHFNVWRIWHINIFLIITENLSYLKFFWNKLSAAAF